MKKRYTIVQVLFFVVFVAGAVYLVSRYMYNGAPITLMKKPSRRPRSVLVEQPTQIESASAGRAYTIFIEKNGREPKNRREYRQWLKENFTTDWEYWYDRYREYREYTDGYGLGSGPFTHKKNKKFAL